ncbi:hypothetical protein NLO83_22350 [Pseudomonas tremae]|uniref:hypothetical protein n=1 Tax=Pseudomonas syringae group TaxID=136849 RepID=UPI0001AF453D|nr:MULTISPECIES: hypothetical protein [Pseudomonas syringae group]MCQ3018324.1 hypothetical protein [Pseudomonas tremae]QGL59216.1 hypothetical protein POR16_24195 [Pseudomonas coronafaciens pv. oryzae str. 1_6]RMM31717.1 hypothetical protein ALQ80_03572 [Pseudomonas coronafaciens pv. oryzae]
MQFLMKLAGIVGFIIVVGNSITRCSDDGDVSRIPAADVPAPAVSDAPVYAAVSPDMTEALPVTPEEENDCYTDVSPPLRALINDIGACDLETALRRHNSSVLSVIPAKGFKEGVAGVFKKYHLHVNQNADVECSDLPLVKIEPRPGCVILIHVSRVRDSGKYSELAGWSALWFRGVGDSAFKPISPFAEHLSTSNDSMLKVGGFMEASDRP